MIGRLLLCILAMGVSGCSTNIVGGAGDVSEVGKKYSDTVDVLIDKASDLMIGADNDRIKQLRLSLEGMTEDEIKKDFDIKNENISKSIEIFDDFKKSTKLLREYFTLLGEVANNNSQYEADLSESTGFLIEDINNFYKLKETERKITDSEKGYISKLVGIAGKSMNARRLRALIQKTAEPVGRLLVHNGYLIKLIKIDLERLEKRRLGAIKKQLYAGYRSNNIDESWVEMRKDWLKSELKFSDLDRAVEASDELKVSWFDVVNGKQDIRSFSGNLQDLNSVLSVIAGYKTESETKEE